MNDRKTLGLRARPDSMAAPSIRKKGRGWEISETRLDVLHDRAREMRRNPTAAQQALATALTEVDTGGFTFKRQQVIGSAIVDFACKPLMMVIELDGDDDSAFATTHDRSLTDVDYRVERLSAAAVLADPAATASQIAAAMRDRWHERREQARTNRAPRRRPQE